MWRDPETPSEGEGPYRAQLSSCLPQGVRHVSEAILDPSDQPSQQPNTTDGPQSIPRGAEDQPS